MGYLNNENIENKIGANFEIELADDNVVFKSKREKDYQGYFNDSNYIEFMTKGLQSKLNELNSVLIVGLGIGVIPQWIASETNCEIIDVLDIDNELINTISSFNYLSDKINIIEGDVYKYNTLNKYDAIVFDIWFVVDNMYESQKESLKLKYKNNLNPKGILNFPINMEIF